MAFLARCPDCGQFQVCVFDLDSKVNLKCCGCGTVFPSAEETPVSTTAAVNWSLAITLREYEFEPPRLATENLVVVQDLPSVYPRRKRRRRRAKKRRRVPVAVGAPEFVPVPPTPGPEPEFYPEIPAEPRLQPTEEGRSDSTTPHGENGGVYGLATPGQPPFGRSRYSPAESPLTIPVPDSGHTYARLVTTPIDGELFVSPEEDGRDRIPGLIALTVAGVALILSQLPLGWWLALAGALVGIVLSVRATIKYFRPAAYVALGLNALLLLVLFVVPSWLGQNGLQGTHSAEKAKVPLIIGHDGAISEAGDGWVDVSSSFWQFDDVRVTAGTPVIDWAHLRGPDEHARASKKQYLIVRVNIGNSGLSRDFPVPTWTQNGEHALRLSDATGRQMTPAVLEPGWAPMPPQLPRLGPTQTVDLLFLFEVPAVVPVEFRLELPGQPLGIPQTIRLKLPRPQSNGGRTK